MICKATHSYSVAITTYLVLPMTKNVLKIDS